MTPEQMQNIIDNAPEWAKAYNTKMKMYTNGFIRCSSDVYIDDLRTELAKREPIDLSAVDIPRGTIVLEK